MQRIEPGEREAILKIVALIHQDPQQHYSIAALAVAVGASLTRVKQLFKAVTGRPFYQQVFEIRMQRATELLAATELPIPQIARKVGYRNTNAFSRAFRKYTKGISASQYRLRYPGG
ncbi:MAG: AraC family transcriptional regulator [Candidatus Pseudobacter hemicellulosilyticus]|uniref:AraC family transcriptional regulator n=1 Tax=Candidatus Pseudobacter hemicellulosilyticus TaxID=3121375 RepID=A0AAJ5WW00_9BACT|nr:MAG: AraC family transcriptional regulator [Pseudobacter sp.]